jgi:hypothetical protein
MTINNNNKYINPPIVSSKHKSMITLNNDEVMTVTPSSSSNDLLNQQPQQQPQQPKPQQVQGSTNQRELEQRELELELERKPFKKRKMSMSMTIIESSILPLTRNNVNDDQALREEEEEEEEEEEIHRRKLLASKLRADNVSQRIMIRPSAYCRVVFLKNGLNPNKLHEYANTNNGNSTNACSQDKDYYYPQPTQLDIDIHHKHSQELYDYVRKGDDLDGFKRRVRELKEEYYPQTTTQQDSSSSTTTCSREVYFRCCNKFGESLMHLACRRGRTDMVQFLIEELNATNANDNDDNDAATSHTATARAVLSIRDDYNKTPFHDACWTTIPNFELIDLLLKYVPEQLLMKDLRGKTPFDYVQITHYPLWLKFIWERKSLFKVPHE